MTVPVILDGENAWEHYAGGGRPFLRALYRRLADAADIDPVQMRTAASGPAMPLARLFAGSWINADFGIWMGHRDDRQAWTQLRVLRERYEARSRHLADDCRQVALDAILAAEGSDWFWWYGDDHSSAHDREFDALFRQHLRRAYRALGDEVPDELYLTNISTEVPGDEAAVPGHVGDPADPRQRQGRYFERLGAVSLERPAGSMHRASARVVTACLVGVAVDGLALWIDTRGEGCAFVLEVTAGVGAQGPRSVGVRPGGLVVPWSAISAGPGASLGVRIVVRNAAGRIVETVPSDGVERRLMLPERVASAVVWTA